MNTPLGKDTGLGLQRKGTFFSSRLGMFLSILGVAVGTGNIWRFSRIVAQNGGGSFLIPWVIFLFAWSIPLIIAELSLGRAIRRSPVGVFGACSPKLAWMGAFISVVNAGIMCYYTVVAGWSFGYCLYSLFGGLDATTHFSSLWDTFQSSYYPIPLYLAILGLGGWIIHKGVAHGIERCNKILIPIFLVILVTLGIRAVTLPGAAGGLDFLFTPHWEDLGHYELWLQALTQNVWDTGAGWGFFLVYGGYIRAKEDIVLTGTLTGIGNNLVSLLAGVTIFSAAFAIESSSGIAAIQDGLGSTNEGLAFIFLPHLFQQLPGGPVVHLVTSTLFFLALCSAAITSLIAMINCTSETLKDLGIPKKRAIWTTLILGAVVGLPSAISMKVFLNQDWVWSLGLILSGAFIAVAVLAYGMQRFYQELRASPYNTRLGSFYPWMLGLGLPVQAIALMGWWFWLTFKTQGWQDWIDPFALQSAGTCLLQWGVVLTCTLFLNKWMVRRLQAH